MTITVSAAIIPIFVAIIVLLLIDNYRRRAATHQKTDNPKFVWITLAYFGGILLFLGASWYMVTFVGTLTNTAQPIDAHAPVEVAHAPVPQMSTVAELPVARETPPAEAAEKGDDEYSQAVASKTVGMLRAMVRALGRALVEEEKSLAEKKGEGKPVASPAGKGNGEEEKKIAEKTAKALTLALSQRERGPDSTFSSKERGPNSAISPGEKGPESALVPKENGQTARPAWVNAVPCLVGDAYRMSISVGPYTSRAECDAQLPDALQKALDQYVEACLGDQTFEEVRLPSEELRKKIVKNVWQETRQYSVGPMIQLHALLEFDREIKDRVLDVHRQAVVNRRLQGIAVWTSLGLSVLAVMFGYLKTDLATGGAYRGRLRWVVLVALLGVVALAAVVGYS